MELEGRGDGVNGEGKEEVGELKKAVGPTITARMSQGGRAGEG